MKEFQRYNPSIPMKIPFPGPSQCVRGQKLMLIGTILDNNQVRTLKVIKHYSISLLYRL